MIEYSMIKKVFSHFIKVFDTSLAYLVNIKSNNALLLFDGVKNINLRNEKCKNILHNFGEEKDYQTLYGIKMESFI